MNLLENNGKQINSGITVIQLTKQDRLTHRATWHEDEDLCKRNGALLAADVMATRERLLKETLQAKFGYVPALSRCKAHLHEVIERETGIVWICWDVEALAIRTEPKAIIEGTIYSVTWFFKSLVQSDSN